MIKVYIKKIQDFDINETENIKNTLSAETRERLNKKRNKALHLASLCALSLLTDKQRSDLSYTESGRPHFETLDEDISISHSPTHVAIAISNSKNTPVGIDIEANYTKNISTTRFLTENEQLLLKNETPYVEIWTKKEALFKYLKNDSTPFIHLNSATPEQYNASFTTLQIENSTLTICAPSNEEIEIIQK